MDNDKPQSLSVIVGERLKVFRQVRGLRQADVADAANACGLPWGRSSVAALEGGTRNLSIEELALMPLVISQLGGWDDPLLPGDSTIALTDSVSLLATDLAHALRKITRPIGEKTEQALPRVEREIEILGRDYADTTELDFERVQARYTAWKLFLGLNYPEVNYHRVLERAASGSELKRKVAERLDIPHQPRSLVSSWEYATFLPWALWGRPLQDERDARTAERGAYDSKRSLQAARGHATREMITELSTEIANQWPALREVFRQLEPIWGDENALKDWVQSANDKLGSLASRKDMTDEPSRAMNLGAAAWFREIREGSRLTLEEFAKAHDMPVEVVQALEAAEFDRLKHGHGEYIGIYAEIGEISVLDAYGRMASLAVALRAPS